MIVSDGASPSPDPISKRGKHRGAFNEGNSMDARNTERITFLRGDEPPAELPSDGAGPQRIVASLRERVLPKSSEGASRLTLEELFRAIVRDELRPFVDMIHGLVERLGRAAAGGEEFLSVSEAATVAHVGKSTIRGWIREGRLRAGRAGRLPRIRRTDLTALITAPVSEARPNDPEVQAARILERNRPTER
jgi:excisionase family DNA binding protein